MLEKLLELDVRVIATGCYFVTKTGFVIGRRICGKFRTTPGDPISDFPKINPSLLLYDRVVFDTLGGFPQSFRIGEDGMFNRKVFKKYSIVCLPDPLVLKEKDDEGKSRKILLSYEKAMESFRQKMDWMNQELSESDYAIEYEDTRMLHLNGFLSVGNMAAAKKWHIEMNKSSFLPSGSVLVRLSVSTGVNFYLFAMKLQSALHLFQFLPKTIRYWQSWR
jgi:hypothetical protein